MASPQGPQGQSLQSLTIVWAALTAGPVVFALAAGVIRASMPPSSLPMEFAAAAVAFAVVGAIAMRVVAPKLVPARADRPALATYFTRTLLGLAFGEFGALVSVVAFLLTGLQWALAGVAVYVVAALSAKPGPEGLAEIEAEIRRNSP